MHNKTMPDMRQKEITFFGRPCCLICDGRCDKAWGTSSRPRVTINGLLHWVADNEFDKAPDDPGTYEGRDGKPHVETPSDMNKWCARSCERSRIIDKNEEVHASQLIDFNKRICIE